MSFVLYHMLRLWFYALALLMTIPAWCQAPPVTITGTDSVSHSTLRVQYIWTNGPLTSSSILYAVSPTPCTNGRTQQATTANYGSPWAMVLAGLTPATAHNVCISVSNNSGTTTSAPVLVTTSALPAVHPALPIRPASFDGDYPDTTGYAIVTTRADCSDLQSDIDDALYAQASHKTVINIPAGSVCTALPAVTFHVDAAEVRRHNQFPMPLEKFSPCRFLIPFGRQFDALRRRIAAIVLRAHSCPKLASPPCSLR
jgi:hypothetical protein